MPEAQEAGDDEDDGPERRPVDTPGQAAIAVRELDEEYAERSNDLCARYADRIEDAAYHALLARFDVLCDDGIRDAGEFRDLRVAAGIRSQVQQGAS